MTYLLIPIESKRVSETSFLFDGAVKVEVCPEDGTVYSAVVLMCPTCDLKPDPRWGG